MDDTAATQAQVAAAAARWGVPVELALAVARAESGYRQYAADGSVLRSSAGALGIMQLMPATAAELGVDATDPAQNIDGGVRYLAELYRRFGDWNLVPAAYNAGPGALERILAGVRQIPAETAAYVERVLGKPWEAITGQAAAPLTIEAPAWSATTGPAPLLLAAAIIAAGAAVLFVIDS